MQCGFCCYMSADMGLWLDTVVQLTACMLIGDLVWLHGKGSQFQGGSKLYCWRQWQIISYALGMHCLDLL
jgi:hypothetical protein